MKKLILLCLFIGISLHGQSSEKIKIEGKISYISSQYYYIAFPKSDGIKKGDTLYIKVRKKLIPKFIVERTSSHSCAAKLLGRKVKKGRTVFAFVTPKIKSVPETKEKKLFANNPREEENSKHKHSKAKKLISRRKSIGGKYSLSGYSNFSNIAGQTDYQYWRHSFSYYNNRISGSNFSFSSYITFRYRSDKWNYVSSHIGEALKVYDLSLTYRFDSITKLVAGRKINRYLSSLGAVDGVQFETIRKGFRLGGVLGSRPNNSDYGYNFKLLEMGVYVSRDDSVGTGKMTNTLSILQQMNDYTTDRRFLYFQHSSNFIKHVYFFFSTEIDFFKHYHGNTSHDPYLTNIFVSLRVSPAKWISLTTSYDARKNIIYYETYKSFIDRLINNAMRQGFRVRVNLRPVKYVFASVYSGYRFRKDDKRPSKNLGVSITHSKIPFLNLSANLNYFNISSNYISGVIYGVRISKNLFRGTVTLTTGYKNINYDFLNSQSKLVKDAFLFDLSLQLARKLSLSLSYEGTFEHKDSYSNLYFNITQRF